MRRPPPPLRGGRQAPPPIPLGNAAAPLPDPHAPNEILPAEEGQLCLVGRCLAVKRPADVTVRHVAIGGTKRWPYCRDHAWPYYPRKAKGVRR